LGQKAFESALEPVLCFACRNVGNLSKLVGRMKSPEKILHRYGNSIYLIRKVRCPPYLILFSCTPLSFSYPTSMFEFPKSLFESILTPDS